MVKGCCLKTLHSYRFEGDDGMVKMQDVMKMFRFGFREIGGIEVDSVTALSQDCDGYPGSDSVEYRLAGGSTVTIKPSVSVPEVGVTVSVISDNKEGASKLEESILTDIENIIYIDYGASYCCE